MSESDLGTDFKRERDLYCAFTASLENLIRNLVSAASLEPFAYESRTKTLASLQEKNLREDKIGKYETLSDITDLSGVRIICFLQEECDEICKILEEEFAVDIENSSSKLDQLDPDKFGYLSTHFVVSINSARSKLVEFKRFEGLKAEIQVRTLLQHTWAAIDWKFRYKEEKESPKPLRRRLFRISALLEAADNEFSQVNIEIDSLRKEYSESLSSGQLEIPINTESVVPYLKENKTVELILQTASKAGIRPLKGSNHLSVQRFVRTADLLGLKTVRLLDQRLKELLPHAKAFYESLSEGHSGPSPRKTLVEAAIVRYLLIGFAPSGKRQLTMKETSVSKFYSNAISEFGRTKAKDIAEKKT